MRITGGTAGGQRVGVPKGIRPTQDRVKEAYFSKMGDMLVDARFLDLFAGSGAIGIEACSRGASHALIVERNRTILKACESNIEKIGVEAAKTICADALRFVASVADAPYSLIYADPPYAMVDKAFIEKLLGGIRAAGWLAEDGIVTLERRVGGEAYLPEGWVLLDSRSYGGSALDFYVLA
jgi:16S rRNA (guanine966-N2)-methyltransferase